MSTTKDVTIKLYYKKFPNTQNNSPMKLQESMEKAMDEVRKDHYLTFYKHLPICDPSLRHVFALLISSLRF